MKQLIFFLCLFGSLISQAQDRIILREGGEIEAKVVEVGITEIKYKKWSNQSGPIYVILKNDVQKIIYENGSEDMFSLVETPASSAPKSQDEREPSSNLRKTFPVGLSGYLLGPTLGVSFDASYFVSPNIEFQGGIGLVGFYTGLKYHFGGNMENRNKTFYTGAIFTMVPNFNSGGINPALYAPIGIIIISQNGFFISPEAAAFVQNRLVFPYIGVRIGGRLRLE